MVPQQPESPVVHESRDLAKRAVRDALDAVTAVTVRQIAHASGVSYDTLYAYADLGTPRPRGVRRGGRAPRKNSPRAGRMRDLAEAIRQQSYALAAAADRLDSAADVVEEAEVAARISA